MAEVPPIMTLAAVVVLVVVALAITRELLTSCKETGVQEQPVKAIVVLAVCALALRQLLPLAVAAARQR